MIAFFKRTLIYARRIDFKDLIDFVTSAIAIVAFLVAADYFSARSSLYISIMDNTDRGYNIDSLLGFYADNDINIPNKLYENQTLKKLFTLSNTKTNLESVNQNDGVSDYLLVKAIAKGKKTSEGYIDRRIGFLEKQLDEYTYKKRLYTSNYDGRIRYKKQDFKPILSAIRKELSSDEYYTFLSALIHSRERYHFIYIQNNGDVDLKDVEITIPCPVSKITESRDGNILAYKIIGNLLHVISESNNNLKLSLPYLKKDQFLSVQITTRENQINKDEIFYSYNRDNILNKKHIFLYLFGILLSMLILKFFFIGKNTKPVASAESQDEASVQE